MLATQKDYELNTVKEFVKFGFPNINESLDSNIKDDLNMINDFLTYRNRIVIPDALK